MPQKTKPVYISDADADADRVLLVMAGACSLQGVRRDTNEDMQYVSPEMDLTDALDDSQLLNIISQHDNPQQAAEALTQQAVAAGAGDDVTCVVFAVQSGARGV